MIKIEVLWDNVDGDAIVWCQNDESAEITCISGDEEMYYDPDKLLDTVLFMEIINSMNISDNDRNNIRKYITELLDEFNKV